MSASFRSPLRNNSKEDLIAQARAGRKVNEEDLQGMSREEARQGYVDVRNAMKAITFTEAELVEIELILAVCCLVGRQCFA